MSTITTIDTPPSSQEIWKAYRKSQLKRRGVSFLRALNDPLLMQSLTMMVDASRKKEQQYGKPAPVLQAA